RLRRTLPLSAINSASGTCRQRLGGGPVAAVVAACAVLRAPGPGAELLTPGPSAPHAATWASRASCPRAAHRPAPGPHAGAAGDVGLGLGRRRRGEDRLVAGDQVSPV